MGPVNPKRGFMPADTICVRIQSLVDDYHEGNLKGFARKTKIPYSTLHNILSEQRDDLMLRLVDKILIAFPSVQKDWLYSGKGGRGLAEHQAGEGECGLKNENILLLQRVFDLEEKIQVYKTALAAKDEALAAKDIALAAKDIALASRDEVLGYFKALSAELVLKKDKVPGATQEKMQYGGLPDIPTSLSGSVPTQTTVAAPSLSPSIE